MKYLIIAIVFLVSCGSHLSKNRANKTEYYRHIVFRESPYADIKGIYKIDESQAQHTVHYKFDYDSAGRLKSLSYMLGDVLLEPNATQNWDSFFMRQSRIAFSYSSGKEVRHFYDTQNNPMVVNGQVFKEVYTLAHDGTRKNVTFYDYYGNPVNSQWGMHRYEWVKKNDLVIEKRYNLKGEQVAMRPNLNFYEVHLNYGSDGYLKAMYNYGKTGIPTDNNTGVFMDSLTYDKNGNFTSWRVYDKHRTPVNGNNPGVFYGVHSYDEYGNKTKLEFYDTNGDQKNSDNFGYATLTKTYDSHFNLIEARHFNAEGKLIESPRMPSIRRMTFEKNGINLIEVSGYNSKDQLVRKRKHLFGKNHNIKEIHLFNHKNEFAEYGGVLSKLKYTYNASENLILEQSYHNKNDDLVLHPRTRIARIVYKYDTNNYPTDTLNYDVKGNIIQ